MSLHVLSVASEAVPLAKTGGLADVVGALPAALAAHGVKVTTLLPGYPSVLAAAKRAKAVHSFESLLGEPARLLSAKLNGHPLLILDAPAYFARDGGPYGDPSGKDWPDNWRRFAAFGRAAADLAAGQVKGQAFDLIHAHDWQAGMALAYLRFASPKGAAIPPSVMTIHNMAFQGYFPASVFAKLGLPKKAWALDGVESYGGVGFLKAGLEAASAITTVSPTYAREIRAAEFGMGLEGLIQSRGGRVRGIVNGIDTTEWNPALDTHIAKTYTPKTLSKRTANKRAVETAFGLDRDDGPLFIVISRLTWQKGMDVLVEVIDHLVGIGGRLALLGSGDATIADALHQATVRHPGKIGIRIGYDEARSHQMQAGGDAILVPSRFEPCGLTQLYGLAYGCVPIVARTGGLADTIIDANLAALNAGAATGLQFTGVHADALADVITRAVHLYQDRTLWTALQQSGMKADFSWARSGAAYADLFKELTATS